MKPGPGDSDFEQWQSAMKMVARLPDGVPHEFRNTVSDDYTPINERRVVVARRRRDRGKAIFILFFFFFIVFWGGRW